MLKVPLSLEVCNFQFFVEKDMKKLRTFEMIPGYLNVQEVASIPYKRLILKTMFMSMKLYDCLKVVE